MITKNLLRNVNITKVVCGKSHTLALNDNGQVYSWGDNSYGKLGQGKKPDIKEPELVIHNFELILIFPRCVIYFNITLIKLTVVEIIIQQLGIKKQI